jgi:hypothetical protein
VDEVAVTCPNLPAGALSALDIVTRVVAVRLDPSVLTVQDVLTVMDAEFKLPHG